MQAVPNIIAGSPKQAVETYSVFDPATLEPVARAPETLPCELDEAVDAARRALQGAWSRSLDRRRRALSACGDILEANAHKLAQTLSREQGKPLAAALGEVATAGRICRYYATLEQRREVIRQTAADFVTVVRAPVGVVGLVVPWNFPITILFMKLAPALWAGNSVIVKPAPTTPLATLDLCALLAPVLPPGILNTASGGNAVGVAVTRHPGIRKISFTGSTATGRNVMQAAAPTLKRLTLELGGNDAAIVLDDADLDVVAPRIFSSAFNNAGQLCVAIKRLYVHQAVYQDVVERLRVLAAVIKIGHGIAPGTQMGPVNNLAQKQRVEDLLDEARARGAHVFQGSPLPSLPGHFISPAIVTGLDASARLVAEEQFGPALPVLPFDDIDMAIEQANASEFGLGASVWSSDADRAAAIAAQLEAGNLYVNHHAIPPDPQLPFGGIKSSGFGYELGDWGVDEFTDRKVLRVEMAGTPA